MRIDMKSAVCGMAVLGALAMPLPGLWSAAAAPTTAPTTAPADNASAAEKLFKDGSDALYQGQYDKAIELLTKASTMDKDKSSYRLHLARAPARKRSDAADGLSTQVTDFAHRVQEPPVGMNGDERRVNGLGRQARLAQLAVGRQLAGVNAMTLFAAVRADINAELAA